MTGAKTSTLARRSRALAPWASVAILALAAWSIHRAVRRHGLDAVGEALRAIEPSSIAVAALCAAGSYSVLTLFDWLALRSATSARPRYPSVALASFVALSVGHVVGFAVLSSGAIRYRLYARFGLGLADVGRMLVFCGVTVLAGLSALTVPAGLFRPAQVAEFARVPPLAVRALALAAAALLAAYVALSALRREPLRLFGFLLPLPRARVALAQVAVGAANYLLIAALLHELLGDATGLSLLAFASFYAVAHLLAILSHVPGGLGVIEMVVLWAAPGPRALGALALFRLLYFLLPFVLGSLLYGAFELRELLRARRARDERAAAPAAKRASAGPGTRRKGGGGGLPGRRARLDERDDAPSKRAKP